MFFIQIRGDVKSGVYVENLTEEDVSSMKDVTQLLIKVFVKLTLPRALYYDIFLLYHNIFSVSFYYLL